MSDERLPQQTIYGQFAGFVTRLLAFLIDSLITSLILSAIGLVAAYVFQLFNINEVIGAGRAATIIIITLAALLSLWFLLAYGVGFLMLAGQTPGKRIMGIRVVRTGGDRLTFGAALVRWLGYWLSAILFLGYLWVLVDNRRQGFHDKLAGTLVVYAWPEPEDEGEATAVRDRVRRFRERRGMSQGATG